MIDQGIVDPLEQAYVLRKLGTAKEAILKVTGLKKFEFEHRIAFLFRGKRSYARNKIGDVEALLRYKNVRCLLEDMERRYKNA